LFFFTGVINVYNYLLKQNGDGEILYYNVFIYMYSIFSIKGLNFNFGVEFIYVFSWCLRKVLRYQRRRKSIPKENGQTD